jgi:hypothetical protein
MVQQKSKAFITRVNLMLDPNDKPQYYWGGTISKQNIDSAHKEDETVFRKAAHVIGQENHTTIIKSANGVKQSKPPRMQTTTRKKSTH